MAVNVDQKRRPRDDHEHHDDRHSKDNLHPHLDRIDSRALAADHDDGGTNALYANSLIGLGTGATLDLNGHNVYLLNAPVNMTFTGAGGVFVVPEPSSMALLALAGLALLRRRR